ncbi:MAG: hypothetical protein ACFB9N_11875 [Geitlerinemataceae cyanobacterium]
MSEIKGVLEDAEVLTRCPTEIPGLTDAISLLKTELDRRQTAQSKTP